MNKKYKKDFAFFWLAMTAMLLVMGFTVYQ